MTADDWALAVCAVVFVASLLVAALARPANPDRRPGRAHRRTIRQFERSVRRAERELGKDHQ